MLIVPGSVRVKLQAETEGLDTVFLAAGADWREAGCSMCLAMNPDKLAPGSAVPRLQIAILKDAKARAAGPTWSHRRWRRPRR